MAISDLENDKNYDTLIAQKGYTKFHSDDDDDDDDETIVDEIIMSDGKDEQPTVDITENDQTCDTIFQNRNNNSIRLSLSQEQICIDKNKTNKSSTITTRNRSKTILSNKQHLSILPETDFKNNKYDASLQPHIKINDSTKIIRDGEIIKEVVHLPRHIPLRKFSVPTVGNASNKFTNNDKERSRRFDRRNTLNEMQLPNYLEKFKCSFCKHFFNDPRVLDCLHTFCLQCITIMESNNGYTATTKIKSIDIAGGELEYNC